MKSFTFPDVPGWLFDVREVSVNIYHVEGRDTGGRSVEKTGTDSEAILAECHRYARDLVKAGI